LIADRKSAKQMHFSINFDQVSMMHDAIMWRINIVSNYLIISHNIFVAVLQTSLEGM